MTAGWASFLDSLESELQGIERTEGGRARPLPFVPPTGLGDLPGPLADRAREIVAGIEEAVARVSAELRTVEAQLEEQRRLAPLAPHVSSQLDTSL